ncbi:transposase [Nitrosophilus labii]|uniref:transposase n=1 Tax=Nitrosophilus labii TaxID=2706014 RepID=UPI001656D0A1|nr:transposase [Nitrosophilus labii]
MVKNNLILKEGTIVDTTLIHASEPTRKEDKEKKVVSNKVADSDATYTSKRGRKYHGFKMHIASDTNGIIKEVITTTAKESDIKQLDRLTENEKSFYKKRDIWWY